MFPPLNRASQSDLVATLDKANGMIWIANQKALVFGSNRKTPVARRPVVALRRDGDRVAVLPCTSKSGSRSDSFFELNEQRVMWQRKANQLSFAYYRWEVVHADAMRHKIGTMNQPARIDLLKWLREHA